jgi:hypothetical protein
VPKGIRPGPLASGLVVTLALLAGAGCGKGDGKELNFKNADKPIVIAPTPKLVGLRKDQADASKALAVAATPAEMKAAVLRLADVTDKIASQVAKLKGTKAQKRGLAMSARGAHDIAATIRAAAPNIASLRPLAARRYLNRVVLESKGTKEVRRAQHLLEAATPSGH